MNKKTENIGNEIQEDPLRKFEGAFISWSKSSDDVWAEIEDDIVESGKVYRMKPSGSFIRMAIAAAVVVILGIPSVMRYYTKTIVSGSSEHKDFILPDGSTIAMNAETTVRYNPLWWQFKRDVKLDGEAYFEVMKGKSFIVESEMASTEVLGTSFNIFSRDNRYEVTCLTGKVKVFSSNEESEIILSPNQKALMGLDGELMTNDDIVAEKSISWTNNEFFFTSVPLLLVIEEIGRQYGVEISSDIQSGLIYTGNFSRNHEIEAILDLVCKPFGIKFEKTKEGTYLLIKDEELQ